MESIAKLDTGIKCSIFGVPTLVAKMTFRERKSDLNSPCGFGRGLWKLFWLGVSFSFGKNVERGW